ncbi:YggS family pyridoxal phosphate-dependent enzyme [Candidatus Pelagibacter sp.]|nr:YggS family pyridoxal phosphate-dependent enzyme [Candidatus Pelagibacter sp.]
MHKLINNLNIIKENLKSKISDYEKIKIIAVSKTFSQEKIAPLIEHGHSDFGENKVQEAIDKWADIKLNNQKINLHLIGKLQTNKVKFAVKLFDYIHSVDNERLARKISDEEKKINKKVKIFIQINIGEEEQKSGLNKNKLENFYLYCKKLNLDVVGLMCIPPLDKDPIPYFKEMQILSNNLKISELSMGMSSDYIEAANCSSTFLRIGSSIFGNRF